MSIEGYIKCAMCHEWFSPDHIDIDWMNSGDNVCHGCGTGTTVTEQENIEAIAGYFMNRINNLHVTIQDLRNVIGGKDRYIESLKLNLSVCGIVIRDLQMQLTAQGVA
jgi:D-mannonate dehydratase